VKNANLCTDEATTKHTENICLREQLRQLRQLYGEVKESKSEIQKLRSQLTEIQTLTSKM
jgi:cell shape-determining protein MreC